MPQDIDFMDFPYFDVKYVHPNRSSLSHLLYPSILERFFGQLTLITDAMPLPPRFGQCRVGPPGRRNTRATLAHKTRGSVSQRIVSLALADPQYVEKLLMRRRLPRLTWTTLCGRSNCLHPLHLRCDQNWKWAPPVMQPRIRTAARRTSEWLTIPELDWMQYRMMSSFNQDPADILMQVSERIGMHFSTLFDVWNVLVASNRISWFETFVVKGEHRI